MTAEPLNLAVLGTGEWARTYHLPALKYLESRVPLRIAGIWNRTTEKAVETAQLFAVEKVYRSLEEVIDDERRYCFCVLVNPRAIPEIIEKLLRRNLPIFTEKSPGRTYREALRLADSVKVPNVVAFNRRYMPTNQQFKALVMKDKGKHLHGVIPAIITPMDGQGNIDYGALEKQASYLSAAGVQGFFIGGTTAEGAYLSSEELRSSFEVVCKVSQGEQFLCLASLRSSTDAVCEEVEALSDLEPDFLVVIAPYYLSFRQSDILEHWSTRLKELIK